MYLTEFVYSLARSLRGEECLFLNSRSVCEEQWMLHRPLGLVFERGWCNNEQAWPVALDSGPEGGLNCRLMRGQLCRERERIGGGRQGF